MDLQKSYDAQDRDRYLDIVAYYGDGYRTLRLLRTYWDRLTMVARVDRYFKPPFKRYLGVTKGNPLSPMIFNVVFILLSATG